MAITTSTTLVPEKGTVIVQVVFKDENGNSVTPNTITWTLTDNPPRGVTATVINSREQVSIAVASIINIVLEGADLALQSGEVNQATAERALTIEFQYDSTIQTNLDSKEQHIFKIQNLSYIT